MKTCINEYFNCDKQSLRVLSDSEIQGLLNDIILQKTYDQNKKEQMFNSGKLCMMSRLKSLIKEQNYSNLRVCDLFIFIVYLGTPLIFLKYSIPLKASKHGYDIYTINWSI